MAVAMKNWLTLLETVESGSEEWRQAAAETVKAFGRLDSEDQTAAVKRLLAGGEAGGEFLDQLEEREDLGLPARVELREARAALGREVAPDLSRRLQNWLSLCEGQEECDTADFFGLPGRERRAVTEHLAQWLRTDLISRLLATAPDKAAAKELKKALHRAKSSGAAALAGKTETFLLPERDDYRDEAYLSPPDPSGVSIAYLYRTVFGKNVMFVIILSDQDGILKFEGYQVAEPKFRRMLESTRKNPHAIVARVDSGYVRRLLRTVEENGRRRGKAPAEDFLQNRRALGVATEPEAPHPLWSLLDAETLRAERGLVARSAELIAHRMFLDWMLSPAAEGQFMVELEEIRHSLLQITETQKREQEDRLFEREAKKTVETVGRVVWRERMLACAYLLQLMQEEEPARMTAATALALAEGDTVPPFFTALLRRTVKRTLGEDDQPEPGPDRGGIVVL